MTTETPKDSPRVRPATMVDWLIWACLKNRLLVVFAMVFVIGWGLAVAPFDWRLGARRVGGGGGRS